MPATFQTELPSPTASDIYVSSNRTALTQEWIDESSDEDGFYIYRTTTSSPVFPDDYTRIDTLAANTEQHEDGNVTEGTTYTYRVTAYTDHVESDPSGELTDYFPKTLTRDISSSVSPITTSIETLTSMMVEVSSSVNQITSQNERVVSLLIGISSSVDPITSNSARGSVSLDRDTKSSVNPIRYTIFNDRTSLELLDYTIDWDDEVVAWYTEWFQESRIIGDEDTLALRSLVVPDAKEPTATITVQYDNNGNGVIDAESDPIDTGQKEEVHEVTGVPLDETGWYRLKITNYSGYNEIYSLDIGLVH